MISLSPVRLLITAAQNNYLKSNMRFYALFAAMLLSGSIAFAQNDDPTIMTINGQPVSRSEFEYSYNKNNSEGVIDKKTVNEYVDLFVNYKLKVLAALDARIDTTASFKQEFLQYRDQQVRPAIISSGDVEAEAQKIYEEAKQRVSKSGGMVHPLLQTRKRRDRRLNLSIRIYAKEAISPDMPESILMTRVLPSRAETSPGYQEGRR